MSRLRPLILCLSASCAVACAGAGVDRGNREPAETHGEVAASVEDPALAAPGPAQAAPAEPADAPSAESAPLVEALPPETTLAPDQAPTPAAGAVLRTIATLRDGIVETGYQGKLVIEPEKGVYLWDCSGMAAWVLHASAPVARRALKSSRPLAKRFFAVIDEAPLDRARRGWQRLSHVSEARPGDVFTWRRSPMSRSRVSGHVGFFVEQPWSLPEHPEIFAARIVDATSLPHGDDTRAGGSSGGFGFGTMLFATDETGETIAYGWHGQASLTWGFMPARVIYGRVSE